MKTIKYFLLFIILGLLYFLFFYQNTYSFFDYYFVEYLDLCIHDDFWVDCFEPLTRALFYALGISVFLSIISSYFTIFLFRRYSEYNINSQCREWLINHWWKEIKAALKNISDAEKEAKEVINKLTK